METYLKPIRGLRSGNRGLTLSGYRQLDYVEPDEIDAIGRVNDLNGLRLLYPEVPPYWKITQVVGRHLLTDELVRSREVTPESLEEWMNEPGRWPASVAEWDAYGIRRARAIRWSQLPRYELGGLR